MTVIHTTYSDLQQIDSCETESQEAHIEIYSVCCWEKQHKDEKKRWKPEGATVPNNGKKKITDGWL